MCPETNRYEMISSAVTGRRGRWSLCTVGRRFSAAALVFLRYWDLKNLCPTNDLTRILVLSG